MRDFVLLYVNGRRHEVRGAAVFQSLSSYLRYDAQLTGTKVVCAEGDCGSCAVLLGRMSGGKIVYRAVTSCIQFVYQIDGMHVITVEGLRYGEALNPVQKAMVKCQGAQCGFCTPGFVVSMCGMLDDGKKLDEAELRMALTGNLCRCTGYESIIKAGMEVAPEEMRRVDEVYPPEAMLAELGKAAGEAALVEWGKRKFFKPVRVEQAAEFKGANPGCVPVAGGTDVGVQLNKGLRDPDVIVSLLGLEELRGISVEAGILTVGALATLGELERRSEGLCPEFARMLWRHGSPLIRNAGTLAGNIANGSPIGDAMPALFVLNAQVELTGRQGTRRVNVNEFYTGYRKSVMAVDEIITRVLVPLPGVDEAFRLYKVSRRHDLDISTFTAAFWMKLEGGVVADIRIAYGGVAAVILRLRRTEQALIGRPFTEVEAVAELAHSEISPISDVRGSRDFRLQLAANILRKFHAEVTGVETFDRVTPARGVAARAVVGVDGNGNGRVA